MMLSIEHHFLVKKIKYCKIKYWWRNNNNFWFRRIRKIEERIKLKEKLKEKIKIAFNSKYMLDALRSLDVEEVILLINEEKNRLS